MAGWMVELGRGFREERARGLGAVGDVGAVVDVGAVGAVGDVGSGEGEKGEMDRVARKLDFLSLCA